MTHPNEELARTEMETALPADFEDMLAHYSENIVLHYPGRNAQSGRYRGRHGLRVWSGKLDELLGPGGSLTRTLHDILASDNHAVQLVAVESKGTDGRRASWKVAVVMHVRDGKISQMWLHIDDPYAVDALLA